MGIGFHYKVKEVKEDNYAELWKNINLVCGRLFLFINKKMINVLSEQ